MIESRLEILIDVLEHRHSWPVLAERLRLIPFDAPHPLIKAAPRHVISTLERFLSGELSALDVEEWANLIEMREDIEFDAVTKDAIWELANPQLTEQLTISAAKRIVTALNLK